MAFDVKSIDPIVEYREPKARTKDYIETLPLVQKFFPNAKQGKLEFGDIGYKDVRIELKTWADFIASLKDERYRKQLYDFFFNHEYIKGYYFIYGSWKEINEYSQIRMNAILGAIASIQARYGVGVCVFPNKKYAVYAACKVIEKSYDGKEVKVAARKRQTDERAVDMLLASAARIGISDAMGLLEKYGTVRNVVNRTEEQLMEVNKIGKVKASGIIKTITFDFKKKKDLEADLDIGIDIEKDKIKENEDDHSSGSEIIEIIEPQKTSVESIEALEKPIAEIIDSYSAPLEQASFTVDGERIKADKKNVLAVIKLYVGKYKKGCPRATLLKAIRRPESDINQAIRDLEMEGIIYNDGSTDERYNTF